MRSAAITVALLASSLLAVAAPTSPPGGKTTGWSCPNGWSVMGPPAGLEVSTITVLLVHALLKAEQGMVPFAVEIPFSAPPIIALADE
ncbi:hypothetical protein ASPZODRAFT_13993 [Penicilliopsis zonata CBS 506.65]|uniref:Alpha-carbonic anhydrase domain-containing protein n=1 Tax=Penicilliopsis zonata CBS 506.65 TaxID=1073090 RepID=A0A1L9SPU4_9EURO|nr:hypothetical protein ASPZODRAFT_13993 [Penicilliopsis zonata CBS 506.65]OJJ49269.1 hypothetical protein ASPZODRAFT_13993 [Penicilliopsis zonata CBS 506.65]